MDTSAHGIEFDEQGRCNFCREFEERLKTHSLLSDDSSRLSQLDGLVAKIKADGAHKPYDCIVGVSGGVDSSWALVQAVKLGLRPLAVHMDNGWDSELAANNIANLIEKLGVDLFTFVIDWDEYRRLMQAFFDADVIDVEMLYDNAMLAVCYQQAAKYRIKYILSGSNTSTEGLRMPAGWSWRDKRDARNTRAIASSHGVKIRSLPLFSNLDLLKHHYLRGTRWVLFLDHLDYNKQEALTQLQRDYAYKPYPYKHYESVFTRFYQGYLLPQKFGVDKRRVHLSSLIVTGQLSRAEAVAALEHIPYPDPEDLERDKVYFLKKMNWSAAQLDAYLARPERQHDEWATDPIPRTVFPMMRWGSRVLSRLRGKLVG
jgi:N-acetyl sugar amidotransferase